MNFPKIPFLDKLPFFKKKDDGALEGLEIKPEDIRVEDIIAPSLIEIKQHYIKLGERYAKTFFIFSYPRYLSAGWLSPVINLNYSLDVSLHIHPVNTGNILKSLRKKLTEIQAELAEREEKGLIRDPALETAYQDIEQLRDELQTARERVFRLGAYLTVYGDDEKELRQVETILRSLLEARLLYLKPTLMREKQGFLSTAPYGLDQIMVHTPMNTAPLSSIFPFVSPDLSANEGVLYGVNMHNNSLVLFDRFSLENANCTIFATSGAGKSVTYDTPVLLQDKQGKTRLRQIGPLVEEALKEQGMDFFHEELEGKTSPGFKVWTFDQNLKGQWGEVKIAARKKAPKTFYKFSTQSGRQITTTADHNLVVLENGQIVLARGDQVQLGSFIPLTRKIGLQPQKEPQLLNLLDLLEKARGVYVKGVSALIKKNYNAFSKLGIDERFDRYLYKYRDGRVMPIQYFYKIKKLLKADWQKEIVNLSLVSRQSRGELPALFKISDEFLRVLGYILSEGAVTDKFIAISNIDPPLLADLDACLNKLNAPHFRTKKGINIASTVFVELIKAIGADGRSGQKRVCPFIFNLPQRQIAQFLSAYFEGDGGVELGRSVVAATSKSEELISEISYLLSSWGIIVRIYQSKKAPSNCSWPAKKIYWRLVISGQDNLKQFAQEINFISPRKRGQLTRVLEKSGNTNVDIVPGIAPIFKEIYELFGCQLHGIQDLSNLSRAHFNPSPAKLKEVIKMIEQRIIHFKGLASRLRVLAELPSASELIERGGASRTLNRQLWQELGQSWRVVKNEDIRPRLSNALKMVEIVAGQEYQPRTIKQAVYTGFQEMDLPVKYYNQALQQSIKAFPNSNTRYDMLQSAGSYLWRNYQHLLYNVVPRVEAKLAQLKMLAVSDLFWDPIVKAEKIANKKDDYVYDLTCQNGVFLAGRAGMFVHNSFFVKLEALRYLMQGTELIIVDPENEYEFLADAVGGGFFKISLNSPRHLNPFDLTQPEEEEKAEDVLRANVINLVGLLRIMLGGLSPEEDAIIDRALTQTYARKGITANSHPKDWPGKIPLMSDFEQVLTEMSGSQSLVERVRKYTKGSYAQFFNSPSNISLNKQLIVFGIRDMEDELRPMAMFIILRYIWTQVRTSLKKRLLVVDEAWWIMQSEDGASFLFGICKRARKYWLGVTTITQDVSDFMASNYGRPIITNSAMQLLMKQSPASIDLVQQTFNLTEGEKNTLLESDVGEGIFVAGRKRIALKVVASYTEDQIITSSPEEVKKIREAKKRVSQMPQPGLQPQKPGATGQPKPLKG